MLALSFQVGMSMTTPLVRLAMFATRRRWPSTPIALPIVWQVLSKRETLRWWSAEIAASYSESASLSRGAAGLAWFM
jgi:hypothetical protein